MPFALCVVDGRHPVADAQPPYHYGPSQSALGLSDFHLKSEMLRLPSHCHSILPYDGLDKALPVPHHHVPWDLFPLVQDRVLHDRFVLLLMWGGLHLFRYVLLVAAGVARLFL